MMFVIGIDYIIWITLLYHVVLQDISLYLLQYDVFDCLQGIDYTGIYGSTQSAYAAYQSGYPYLTGSAATSAAPTTSLPNPTLYQLNPPEPSTETNTANTNSQGKSTKLSDII